MNLTDDLRPGTIVTDATGREWVVERRTWDTGRPHIVTLTVVLVESGSEYDPRVRYADLITPRPTDREGA